MSASETRARAPSRIPLGPGPEFDLIADLLGEERAPVPEWLRVPPGDDVAVVDRAPLALSCDLTVEDVHFRREWLAPEEIGWRAAAVALSDLAAAAARPLGVLAAIAIPLDLDRDDARAVGAGVRAAADSVGARLIGGDVSRSPGPLVLDVTAVGRVDRAVLRRGVRPGDEVWVTGRLGGAGAAVRAWEAGGEPAPGLREAFARPGPRTAEALWLAEALEVRAMIDLSDGLAGDAGHLAAASGVRIVVEAERVPLHPALPGAPEALRRALTDGEDYELCLALAGREHGGGSGERIRERFEERFGIPLTRVGRAEEGAGVVLESHGGGREPLEGGYDHLRGGGPP